MAGAGSLWRSSDLEVIADVGIQLIFPLVGTTGSRALRIAAGPYVRIIFSIEPFDSDESTAHRKRSSQNESL
ncbi:hypothetical protein D3C71_2062670 [compost metagenome]